MPDDEPPTAKSVLRKRIALSRRHEWNVGILFAIGTLVFASAIILYTVVVELPKQDAIERQAYRDATQQLADRLAAGVANLSEWSTDESLESYLDTLKEARQTRQARFNSLVGEADNFPLVSSVDAVLSFDRRMRNAVFTLSQKQGEELMSRWSDRRDNVIAIRGGDR
jgi:ABC-type transport system involved in cytochrome bd biosynthesis fused ATPase/permease subunit